MSKYEDLINILDKLRFEAPKENRRYYPDQTDTEKVNQARSRAYIHLFLKVKFGMIDFDQREEQITDGPSDGGIDGYYIDKETKTIYLIQSKFRTTDNNFHNKEIAMEELLAMDVIRIMHGEEKDENDNAYNGKVQGLIRHINDISDMPNWTTKIIILANAKLNVKNRIRTLTGGFDAEVFNYDRVYTELVFPLISGAYFNIKELKITIKVDKNSSGPRIQYYPMTKYGECTVNALYVPTLEIAKILSKPKIRNYHPIHD